MSKGTFYTTEKIGPKQSLTPEGFLLCEEVPVARTGLMVYGPDETPIAAGPDGVTRIFREADEVFRAETIASALGKPVTNDHPTDDVCPESWKELSHGVMLNIRRGIGAMDDLLIGDLLVTTPEGIKAVQDGKREVSLGYEADYTETAPGVGLQSNIIINHIALVEQGRCGPRCAIADHKPTNLKGPTMTSKTTVKKNKVLDFLMQAFKAKDAAEVEKLAEEALDSAELTGEGGESHIHIHTGEMGSGNDPAPSITTDDEEGGDLKQFMESNEAEHAEFRSRLEALEAALAAGSTGDEDKPGDMPKEALDEIPEELRESAAKAKDSAYLGDTFQDTVAMAEILVPGIRVPTFDRAAKPGDSFKRICNFRRQALDLAYAQPATLGTVDDLLSGKALDTKNMTCDAVRTLFRSASTAQKSINNAAAASKTVDQGGAKKTGPMTLAELNKRNAARYTS